MHGKYSSTLAILLFFALMAFFVPQANKMGMGMAGIFYVMVGAGVLVGAGALIVHWIKRRLWKNQTSFSELGSFLAGVSLPPVVDADPSRHQSRALIPVSDIRLARYQNETEEWDEGEEEWEDEEEDLDDWQDEDEEENEPDYARGYRGSEESSQRSSHHSRRGQAPIWQSPRRGQQQPALQSWSLLDLAPRLQVDPDLFSSRRILIAGIPGSGKTNTVRLLLEQWARVRLPFLVIDVDGEYWSLLPALRAGKGLIVGAANRCGVSSSHFACVQTAEEGRLFGEDLLTNRFQAVFDVPSYTDADGEVDEECAAAIFLAIVRGMRAWEQSRSIGERIPSMVVLEEAQIWLPQTYTGSTLSEKTLRALRSLFIRTARDGRRRGIGLVLVAHRLAGILKDVLLCHWSILHEPMRNDLKRYQEFAPEVHRERFLRLSTGRAIVLSPLGTQEVHFHKARTRDQGETPGMQALQRDLGEGQVSAFQGSPQQTISHAVSEDRPVPEQKEPLTPRQQEALTLWRKGPAYQSVRKLAAAMVITPGTAQGLIDALVKKGHIQKNRMQRQWTEAP